MSNLTQRILVALVGIPLILLLSLAGGFSFLAFVVLASSLALYEFYALARAKGVAPQAGTGLLFGVLFNAVFVFDRVKLAALGALQAHDVALPMPSMTQMFLILFLVFVPTVLLIELFRNKPSPVANAGTTVFGVVYVSLLLGSLAGLRELFSTSDFAVFARVASPGAAVPGDVEAFISRLGGLTVITVFAAIWICDTAAYAVGRKMGKHKLFPRVSPNKTWEGAIAGLLFAVATFLLARVLVLPYLGLADAIVCGLIVGIFGQMGDLAESLLKRDAGVKDSSTLIPGHGGALDRFDSLIFVSPLIYVYLDFIVF